MIRFKGEAGLSSVATMVLVAVLVVLACVGIWYILQST